VTWGGRRVLNSSLKWTNLHQNKSNSVPPEAKKNHYIQNSQNCFNIIGLKWQWFQAICLPFLLLLVTQKSKRYYDLKVCNQSERNKTQSVANTHKNLSVYFILSRHNLDMCPDTNYQDNKNSHPQLYLPKVPGEPQSTTTVLPKVIWISQNKCDLNPSRFPYTELIVYVWRQTESNFPPISFLTLNNIKWAHIWLEIYWNLH